MKPSVTKIISQLDKPALVKWANKIGLEGKSLDAFREEKMKAGTSLHKQVENYIKRKIPMDSAEHQANLERFLEGKKIISIEEKIETDYFIGRCDVRFEFGGQLFIGDFKSSDRLYFENKLQLAAYRMAFPVHKICIIHIPSFVVDYVTEDLSKYKDALVHLTHFYNVRQEIEKQDVSTHF